MTAMTCLRALFAAAVAVAVAVLITAAPLQPAAAQSAAVCMPGAATCSVQLAAADPDTRFGYRHWKRNRGARPPRNYRRAACSNACRRGCRRILYTCRGNRAACRQRFRACMRRCGC
jgi:hypothetical protein